LLDTSGAILGIMVDDVSAPSGVALDTMGDIVDVTPDASVHHQMSNIVYCDIHK